MRVLKVIIALFGTISLMSSCSNKGSQKFEGEWMLVEDNTIINVIRNENQTYKLYRIMPDGSEIGAGSLHYDEESDILTSEEKNIVYDNKTKHITIKNKWFNHTSELERKK